MPKAILEFNLEKPYEQTAFRRSSNATNAYIAFHDFETYLRSLQKYDHYQTMFPGDTLSARDHEIAQIIISEIRAKFYNNLNDNNIDMNDLE
jgi:hypothetical protein